MSDFADKQLEEIEVLQQLRKLPQLFDVLSKFKGKELSLQEKLRAEYQPAVVTAAISLHEARQRAIGKLPQAEQLWLSRVGLEQSTAWEVAQHKAKRFPQGEHIRDLCCGLGVDTAALLSRGSVTAVDISEAMKLRCEWNNEIWNPDAKLEFLVHDVQCHDVTGQLIHVDPDRRSGRDRAAKRLENYAPNLHWMQQTVQAADGGAIKLGPASNFMQKFPKCEIELISLNGECREATVWFGSLAGEHSFRATHLPSGESISADPLSAWCPVADEVGDFLFDPDPALVRAGLIDVAGEMHSLQRMDKEDEYFTGEAVPPTSFMKAYRVEAVLSNNFREIKRHVREHPGRDYEIKCRRLSVDANSLQKKLPRGDGPVRVLFFVRLAGKARVVVAQRVIKSSQHSESAIDDPISDS